MAAIAIYLDLHLYLRPIPQDFDTAMHQQLEAAKFPGATVLVFNQGKVIFSKGYGFANIEEGRAATPDTLYQIASVSKLVTATAVMRLYEQGLLQLDDDINQYLPFAVRNPLFPDAPVTFRMLLAHVGSIGDGPAYWDSYTLGQSEDPIEPLGEFLREYFTPDGRYYNSEGNFVDAKPGTQAKYSNVGFGLLGYLVEQISGLPFEKYCRQEIFLPLDMPSSQWFYRDLDKSRMAMPYGYDAVNKTFTPLGHYSFTNYPDGSLKTSTTEFMRFLFLFLNEGETMSGKLFLRPDTVREMLRAQYPKVSDVPGLAWAIVGDKHMHGGSDPGVDTVVYISRGEQWGVIMFANSGGMQAWRTELGLSIRDDLYEYIERYGIPQ
ncbi:serine hydrolase [uncultured Shewanella sp.]|uniref:serine hydrolase domain-containing protein n=1 Tax=Shewanella atlantica TaxID=271099 RepID=UPI002634D423|nr:serine hydrolase domain-containing protein [uncultured Shewanella sp.]